ncbi:YggT family protein [Tsukamurella sp. 1534]|uniref:YggT family protein n=1 Tax=Tsukamurella sp. 1534 TaxID=1151061 RepID=UPI0002EA5420|nr:YggT family protein [Tsukamurella sp. 1534]
MQLIWQTVYILLSIFWFLLLVRIVIEMVKSFAREWFPKGIVAILLEAVFTVTDPPIKLLRRLIPPVTLGPVRLDLAVLVLFLIIIVAQQIVVRLAM